LLPRQYAAQIAKYTEKQLQPGRRNRGRWDNGRRRFRLKAAAKRANLPSTVGLHTLRHSAASVMLSAGVPLKVVSEITGDVYGHLSPDVSREALTWLSDALA
jgi:site-specific recombinase XerD